MPDLQPMPIHLSLDDVAGRPSAGRMTFVIDADGIGESIDLFGRGLQNVFGNYLTGRLVGGGLAAACDDQSFLNAVRTFADGVYAAAGVTVDTTHADLAHVIAGVYPDAHFVLVGRAASADLVDPRQVRSEVAASEPFVVDGPTATLRAPVFVVGCPRSGTTWVQNLLAAHPSLGGPAKETAAFVALRALRDNPAVSLDALRAFAAELFAGWSDVRLIEKTPIHGLYLDFITELFPDASIVGVHRDGRDVVRSLLEVDAGSDDAATAAAFWVEITTAVHAFAQRSARARDERYEDWLVDAVVGAVEVLQWLGLPPDEAVIDELRRRAPQRVSQYNTTGAVGEGKWRTLPESDLRAVYRVAGDCLRDMGYAVPVTRRVSRIERFLRRVHRL